MSVAAETDPRQTVARAVWVCIARDGLARTTMRSIARELGTTTGFLSHYFSNKDEIIEFAIGQIVDAMLLRVGPIAKQPPTLERLEQALHEVMPLDEERRLECAVYVNLLGALVSEDAIHWAFRQQLRDITELIGSLIEGVLPADSDTALARDSVTAMVDGLTIHALLNPEMFTPERQIEMLHTFLLQQVVETRLHRP
jgi:AcrR family transcriptional regulator